MHVHSPSLWWQCVMGHPVTSQLQSCHMTVYVHVCALCVCVVISANQMLQLKQAVCDVTSYNCSYS